MKWNRPMIYDRRVIRRFLFLPEINPQNVRERRWLEFVWCDQEYQFSKGSTRGLGWQDIEWDVNPLDSK